MNKREFASPNTASNTASFNNQSPLLPKRIPSAKENLFHGACTNFLMAYFIEALRPLISLETSNLFVGAREGVLFVHVDTCLSMDGKSYSPIPLLEFIDELDRMIIGEEMSDTTIQRIPDDEGKNLTFGVAFGSHRDVMTFIEAVGKCYDFSMPTKCTRESWQNAILGTDIMFNNPLYSLPHIRAAYSDFLGLRTSDNAPLQLSH